MRHYRMHYANLVAEHAESEQAEEEGFKEEQKRQET
jgi:hypothetical protein